MNAQRLHSKVVPFLRQLIDCPFLKSYIIYQLFVSILFRFVLCTFMDIQLISANNFLILFTYAYTIIFSLGLSVGAITAEDPTKIIGWYFMQYHILYIIYNRGLTSFRVPKIIPLNTVIPPNNNVPMSLDLNIFFFEIKSKYNVTTGNAIL